MNTFEEKIKEKLLLLPSKAKLLFASLLCERLQPHYIAFEENYKWGDKELFENALTLLYGFIINNDSASDDEIKELIVNIDLNTPDMEDFGSALSSFALNACTSVNSALNYILDSNVNHVMDIISYTLDTLDMYIQEKENMNTYDPTRDIQIDYDNFMIDEKRYQLDLVEKLLTIDLNNITDNLLDSLRNKHPIIDLSVLRE